MCAVSTSFDIDYFYMSIDRTVPPPLAPTPAEGAYRGVPASVPGTIEAEEFDEGGEGVGYEDSTDGNAMGAGGSGLLMWKHSMSTGVVAFFVYTSVSRRRG